MMYRLVEKAGEVFGVETAHAHCDIPCGIYDPFIAQIAALTVVRMIDLMQDLEKTHPDKSLDYRNSLFRYISVKEEHAARCKDEIRVIWGDFFKAPHIQMFPQVHELVHKIMQLASKSKQTADREVAVQLVEAVNEFADIFWQAKKVTTKRAKAPYAPGLELVYPVL